MRTIGRPEHVLRQQHPLGALFVTALQPHLFHGPSDQAIQLAQVVGKVVVLESPHHRITNLRQHLPAGATGLLAQPIAQPFAQVLAPHPQRRHPNQIADLIKSRQGGLGSEKHPAAEMARSAALPRTAPMPCASQLQQAQLQGRLHLVELVDQQRTIPEALQQRPVAITA